MIQHENCIPDAKAPFLHTQYFLRLNTTTKIRRMDEETIHEWKDGEIVLTTSKSNQAHTFLFRYIAKWWHSSSADWDGQIHRFQSSIFIHFIIRRNIEWLHVCVSANVCWVLKMCILYCIFSMHSSDRTVEIVLAHDWDYFYFAWGRQKMAL